MYVIGNFEQKNAFGGLLGFVSLKQQHVVEGTFLKNKHMYIKEFHWKFCKKNFFGGGEGGGYFGLRFFKATICNQVYYIYKLMAIIVPKNLQNC